MFIFLELILQELAEVKLSQVTFYVCIYMKFICTGVFCFCFVFIWISYAANFQCLIFLGMNCFCCRLVYIYLQAWFVFRSKWIIIHCIFYLFFYFIFLHLLVIWQLCFANGYNCFNIFGSQSTFGAMVVATTIFLGSLYCYRIIWVCRCCLLLYYL